MIAERASRIKPSPTLAMNAKAQEMKKRGIDVISFSVGEPDFDTPDHIREAAIKAIREGKTKYTPAGGIPELKEAIVEKLQRDNSLTYSTDEVIVSCGAKHSLYNIAQAVLNPGDEVIILSPYWVSYPAQVLLNDGVPVMVDTEEKRGFRPTKESIEEKISARTKAIIINSPSNPAGSILNRETLEDIAEVALKYDLLIVSDEIYEKLIYDGKTHISIASLSEQIKARTIVVNGVSKAYAMTGWRIGYAAGPAEIVKAMTKIQSQSTSNPTSIAQWAALEALRGPQDFLSEMLGEFDRRRRFLVEALNSTEGISCAMPEGAFYAFANIEDLIGRRYGNSTIESSSDLAMYLLEEARVALVPGIAFGKEGYIRLSYALSMERLQEGMERIRGGLGKLS